MRRKNLTVKRKVKKIKSLKKDLKINQIYNKFKTTTFKILKNQRFAIAVSGGSDSLCLAYLSKLYSSDYKNKLDILIVDHKLRKESSKEATKVKNILNKKKMTCKILRWKGKIPKKNIQSKNNMLGHVKFIFCLALAEQKWDARCTLFCFLEGM